MRQAPALEPFCDLHNNLCKTHTHLLREVYTRDVVFQDPLHRIDGIAALTGYFERLAPAMTLGAPGTADRRGMSLVRLQDPQVQRALYNVAAFQVGWFSCVLGGSLIGALVAGCIIGVHLRRLASFVELAAWLLPAQAAVWALLCLWLCRCLGRRAVAQASCGSPS